MAILGTFRVFRIVLCSVKLHSNFDICKWHSPKFIIMINTDISGKPFNRSQQQCWQWQRCTKKSHSIIKIHSMWMGYVDSFCCCFVLNATYPYTYRTTHMHFSLGKMKIKIKHSSHPLSLFNIVYCCFFDLSDEYFDFIFSLTIAVILPHSHSHIPFI